MKENMKLLIFSYGAGHIKLIHQLTKELIKLPEYEIKIIALTSAYHEIKNFYEVDILKSLTYYSFLFKEEITEIKKYGSLLLHDNHDSASGMTIEDSEFYLGFSFNDLVNENGLEHATDLYNRKKRHSFLPTRSIKKIIQYESPDLVITTTSPKCEYAALLASKELNITTLQLIDLFGDDNYPLPSADHIVVMNDYVKSKLQKILDKRIKIHSFGQPIFDNTIKMVEKISPDIVKSKLDIQTKIPIILFTPSRYLIFNKDLSIIGEKDHNLVNKPVFDIFDNLAKDFKFFVIVRPHPNDRSSKFKQYVKDKDYIKIYDNNDLSLFETIAISDFVVAYNSTILIESMLCGKISLPHNYDENQIYTVPDLTIEPYVYSKNFKILKKNIQKLLSEFPNKFTYNSQSSNYYKKGSVNKIINLLQQINNL